MVGEMSPARGNKGGTSKFGGVHPLNYGLTYIKIIMTQPGSPEARSVFEQILKLAIGEQDGESSRTRFTLITKVG